MIKPLNTQITLSYFTYSPVKLDIKKGPCVQKVSNL